MHVQASLTMPNRPIRSAIVQAPSRCKLFAAAVGSCLSLASMASGQVTLLPNIVPGAGGSVARGFGPTGVVLGQTNTGTLNARYIASTWTSGVVSTLPDLPGAPTGSPQFSSAIAANASGVIVGFSPWPDSGFNGQFATRATRWQNGVATDLGKPAGFAQATAAAINTSGQIAGSSFGGGSAGELEAALRWTPGGQMQALGHMAGQSSSNAHGINNSGRVVGNSKTIDSDYVIDQTPVYWDSTTPTALSLPANRNMGDARAINNAGRIVGLVASFDTNVYTYDAVQAAYWPSASEAPVVLPLLPGTIASSATKVNASGDILGFCATVTDDAFFDFGGSPVVWHNGQIIDLAALLTPLLPTFSRLLVSDLNDAGQICGTAITDTGAVAFVSIIPAPGPASVLALGGLFAARRRRH